MKTKSRRKIWSLPLRAGDGAALGGALFAVSVMAQTAPSTVYGTLWTASQGITATTPFASYEIEDLDAAAVLVPEHIGRPAMPDDDPPVTAIAAFSNPAVLRRADGRG